MAKESIFSNFSEETSAASGIVYSNRLKFVVNNPEPSGKIFLIETGNLPSALNFYIQRNGWKKYDVMKWCGRYLLLKYKYLLINFNSPEVIQWQWKSMHDGL